ncbi:unnamed protein product [Adineta steineri]|uniref:Uncharacterized protein n=1 Tax=Adineta steineri TaxID=433720 RepID=A0A815C8C9_9BILA|nr:unnamed protein product [Adineta steineri]
MLPRNHVINLSTLPSQNIIKTSSVYHQLIINKQQQTRRRPTKTTTITTITSTSLISVNITNITTSFSSFISSTQQQQQQQISYEDSYSAKTGIKTAAILGGMLVLVILYLMWKARARLCRSSSTGMRHPRLSAAKFDLDYWLKQVDLLEAKEAERNRGGQYPYLELPNIEPRDNREATASWIVDAYRHWRLIQYRQRQPYYRQNITPQIESNPIPYRRRRYFLRRLIRRLFSSSRQDSKYLMEHSQVLLAGMRPSVVSNHFIPPAMTPNLPIRRTASWPRLKSSHHQTGAPMSALQTHLARKRLLKRTSRTIFDM